MFENLVLLSRAYETNKKAELFAPNYSISCHVSVKFEDCVCVPNNLHFRHSKKILIPIGW
jgi:hypothetical protein